MEGKIITCCGDCGHYDLKKHRCKNGYNDDTNPRKHFYSDCKTLEDLEEHDAKVRADAIDEYKMNMLVALEPKTNTSQTYLTIDQYRQIVGIVAEQLKEQKGD